jgi:hypothetical protein
MLNPMLDATPNRTVEATYEDERHGWAGLQR